MCFAFFAIVCTYSQTTLSADEAVRIALEKNYGIILSKNNSLIDKTNNTIGNSGFLPNISVNAGANYAVNDINQVLTTQTGTRDIIRDGATNSSLSANIALNWTLFDGGKMFVTKNKLSEIEAQGELKTKAQVQQTVFDVINAYYNVVMQKQQLLSVNEAIAYNTERVKILETTFKNGLSPKNFLLQAQIDLNIYKQNAINQANAVAESKRILNKLLSRTPETDFDVVSTIESVFVTDKETLKSRLLQNNPDLLILEKAQEVSKLSVKELNATRYPKVTLNSAYSYSQIENSAGNLLRNNSNGLQVGGSLTMPVFQGGNINRQIKVAKIQQQSVQYSLEEAKLQLTTDLQNLIEEYNTQRELLAIEVGNEALAKENLEITLQRLRFGESTSLEVHLAQESFVQSQTRRINFNYNLKITESRIRQLISDF